MSKADANLLKASLMESDEVDGAEDSNGESPTAKKGSALARVKARRPRSGTAEQMAESDRAKMMHMEGKLEEAEELYRNILEQQLDMYGEQGEATIFTKVSLGMVLKDLDWLDEAEELFRAALQQQSGLYGPDDSTVLQTKRELALCLSEQGLADEAEALFRQILASQEREQRSAAGGMGARVVSRDMLVTKQSLANLLEQQLRSPEAEDLYREVFNGASKGLQDEHLALKSKTSMANLLENTGRVDEAEAIYREVLTTTPELPASAEQSEGDGEGSGGGVGGEGEGEGGFGGGFGGGGEGSGIRLRVSHRESASTKAAFGNLLHRKAYQLEKDATLHNREVNFEEVATIYNEAADLMSEQYGEDYGGVNECRESAARLRTTATSRSTSMASPR